MADVNLSSSNPDVLTPEFKKVFYEKYRQLPSKIDMFYTKESKGPRGDVTKFSEIGGQTNWTEFNGNVQYEAVQEGYDVTLEHKEFTKGFQLERKLMDDDLTGIYSQKPRAPGASLSAAYVRYRSSIRAKAPPMP